MFLQIVLGTPSWVWAILLGVIWLGSSQLAARVTSFARVVRVALFMATFSLYGTMSAFGLSAQVLGC